MGWGKLRLEVGLFEELGTVVRNKNKKWQFEEGMAGNGREWQGCHSYS